jgi:hypothetical protein
MTQEEKDLIVDDMLNNIERIYFQEQVTNVALQMYQNGENMEEMGESLRNTPTSFIPNAGNLDLPAIAVATNRAIPIADVDGNKVVSVKDRAMIELHNQRINYAINRVIELQEDLQAIKSSTGGTANIRAAIRPSYLTTATRPKSDAVQDYKDDINAGNQDI